MIKPYTKFADCPKCLIGKPLPDISEDAQTLSWVCDTCSFYLGRTWTADHEERNPL